mmetsp:Transcript_19202/g.48847  ORF Transcript_19202/g.48847 Transcript_19202/m.48847 type:complete len:453 (-) Transcript_19202:221-1579(-)|eukprot:CAMPEP_0202885060 /NCGR_PEP_ID=MMETSP1391-20130828/41467_1 /ASSEMBLY_ACC=CAM_ASM_000867 /TAXON_ID=1034604 /ORGANISM="Chlamydomonas leiostraca, Strain SAG 11-49" /LENGTH=452 /DNA_ID=CAMNT_0049568299 /DNA_START=327 /DNA_END=1685 /DNA_ORIENTATION=-
MASAPSSSVVCRLVRALTKAAGSQLPQGWAAAAAAAPAATGAARTALSQAPTSQLLSQRGRSLLGGTLASSSRLAAGAASPKLAAAPSLLVRSGASLAGVDPAVKAKARRMGGWVGAVAGLFGSFVGVGGGVLISPVIANACRSLPQRVISGTSLAAVVATGTASGYVYWQSGCVDLTSAAVIAGCAVLSAPLGARATHLFDCAKLRSLMGYWLYFVAPLVPLKAFIFHHNELQQQQQQAAAAAADGTAARPAATPNTASAGVSDNGSAKGSSSARDISVAGARPLRGSDGVLAVLGGVAGFASGLLGIGGGTIVTPLMALVTGLPQTSVVGTSLAAMVVPSCVALAQHARLGNVDWLMAASLVAGSACGSFMGSQVAVHAPPYVLEGLFAIGMAFLGHKTLKVSRLASAAAAAAAAAPKVAAAGGAVGAGAAAGAGTGAAAAKAVAGAVLK